MNTRNGSKRKHCEPRKPKPGNGLPEVFVLPPNLLEKLGIKLDKFQSTVKNTQDGKTTKDPAVNNSEYQHENLDETSFGTHNGQSESSILETASLMKESVFLSPTFVPTIANVIPGEVEIAGSQEECKNIIEDEIHGHVGIQNIPVCVMNAEKEPVNELESVNTDNSDLLNVSDLNDNVFNEEENRCDSTVSPNIPDCVETVNMIHNGEGSQKSLDMEVQDISQKPKRNRKNKINIINDEIIDIANINKLLNFDNNNVVTPVTVDMLLPPSKAQVNSFHINGLIESEISCNQSHEFTNVLNTEKNDNTCEYVENEVCTDAYGAGADVTQFYRESHSGDDDTNWEATVYEKEQFEDIELPLSIDKTIENFANKVQKGQESDILFSDFSGLDNNEDLNIHPHNKLLTHIGVQSEINRITADDNDGIIKDKKYEEDDVNVCNEYNISMVTDNFCNAGQNRHGNEEGVHPTLATYNMLPYKTNSPNNDSENGLRTSKLSIQGVEKPGGSNKSHNAIKTYYNRNKAIKTKLPDKTHAVDKDLVNSKRNFLKYAQKDSQNEAYLNSDMSETINIVADTDCRTAEYCLCSDFGQLSYYDSDNFYEHIHFWKYKNVACKIDLIFSMYVDSTDIDLDKYDKDETIEVLEETQEKSSQIICWSEINVDDEDNSGSIREVYQSVIERPSHTSFIPDVKDANEELDVNMSILDKNETDISDKRTESQYRKNHLSSSMSDVQAKSDDKNVHVAHAMEVMHMHVVDENADVVRNDNEFGGVCKARVGSVDSAGLANEVGVGNKSEEDNSRQGKKRKISVRIDEKDTSLGNTEPMSKRDVKCGVCGQILARRNWEEHANKEHGFVAWKTGEAFMSGESQMNTSTSSQDKAVKCGVCAQDVPSADWFEHIREEHHYMAWKIGETPLVPNEGDQIIKHLHNIIIRHGPLVCSKCKADRKYGVKSVKTYLKHSQSCNEESAGANKVGTDAVNNSVSVEEKKRVNTNECHKEIKMPRLEQTDSFMKTPENMNVGNAIPGPCREKTVGYSKVEKILIDTKITSPLAKEKSKRVSPQKGDTAIEKEISKRDSPLKGDIEKDKPSKRDSPQKMDTAVEKEKSLKRDSPPKGDTAVECGVCKKEMGHSLWLDHIQKAHNYLAWEEKEPPVNFDDENQILLHLHFISKKYDGLICSKCGLNRKHAKSFFKHIKICGITNVSIEACTSFNTDSKAKAATRNYSRKRVNDQNTPSVTVKCGVCGQDIDESVWTNHLQKVHHYLAWKDGENTIDLQDTDQIWKHLQSISKKYDGLICAKCGLNRKYPKAYLSHVKECEGINVSGDADSSQSEAIVTTPTLTPAAKEKNMISHEENTQRTLKPPNNTKTETSRDSVATEVKTVNEITVTTIVETMTAQCGICKQNMDERLWYDHVQKEHNYLAWKDGESSIHLQDEDEVRQHLQLVSKKCDGLVCSKCGLHRKNVKGYLSHIKKCDGLNESSEAKSSMSVDIDTSTLKREVLNTKVVAPLQNKNPMSASAKKKKLGKADNNDSNTEFDISAETTSSLKKYLVKCDVCKQEMANSLWYEHIQKDHDYRAWKEGEPPVDLNDIDKVKQHLYLISKKNGGLVCSKCGLSRKYVKAYLGHVEVCDGSSPNDDSLLPNCSTELNTSQQNPFVSQGVIKCGVCEQNIEGSQWIPHIETKHNYLAWIYGEKPLDVNDTEILKEHFTNIRKYVSALRCSRCGFEKIYPKVFIPHIQTCDATPCVDVSKLKDSDGLTECAMCSEKMSPDEWASHATEKHYTLAWRVGDFPLDIKSPYSVEKILKKYKRVAGDLVCKNCGISRASPLGFFAHIAVCGKSEKEIERFHSVCEICNKSFLGIYKSQHMKTHKEEEYANEIRMKYLEKKDASENMSESFDTTGDEITLGRRKAAVKARGVIEKLKADNDDSKICGTCGFQAATTRKLETHKCFVETFDQSGSETDDSYESVESSEPASSPEPEIAGEQEEPTKKKRSRETALFTNVPKTPFKYNKLNSYLEQNEENLVNVHFTNEILFPQWLDCKHDRVNVCDITNYLPKMERSCQIKLNEKWETYSRYQVQKYRKGSSMFVGGSIHCLAWVPPRLNGEDESNYLSISCHLGSDTPRHNFDELSSYAGVIQIWDFGTIHNALPKLAFSIAHDYGTVWAMDWCPSGAREPKPADDKTSRLGLLAVACSNGFTYIFSVPYPSETEESDKVFYKLKPVAELRITMSPGRKLFQATAITWSKQKDHAIVMVGYADGTTAFYDLCSTSPLLQSIEDGVTIVYPYDDRREHNVCITDVDIHPTSDFSRRGRSAVGAVCSSSMTGSAATLPPRFTPVLRPTAIANYPTTACKFIPGWPTAFVANEDNISMHIQCQLDWYGCPRRLPPISVFGGCARCSRMLMYSPPHLWYLDTLPPYVDSQKTTVALMQPKPLAKKRKIKNDSLTMLVEPLTYEEVITQYGIEVTIVDPHEKQRPINRDQFTERFPLADVAHIAFCPTARHHSMAALGLRAGFVLLLTV